MSKAAEERVHRAAVAKHGAKISVSVDAQKSAPHPVGNFAYVARVWSETGKCIEWGGGDTRTAALVALAQEMAKVQT